MQTYNNQTTIPNVTPKVEKKPHVLYDKMGIKVTMYYLDNGTRMFEVTRENPITKIVTSFNTTVMPILQFGHLTNALNDYEDMKADDMNEDFDNYEIID
jgi:hypothetical protein